MLQGCYDLHLKVQAPGRTGEAVKRKGARRRSRPLSHEAARAISASNYSDDSAAVGFGSAEESLAGGRP
jgi:hypothetical protein